MSQITVTNPDTGDVRVVPAELRDRYESRGFDVTDGPAAPVSAPKARAKKATKRTAAKATAPAAPAEQPAAQTE